MKQFETIYIDSPYRPQADSFCKPKSIEDGRYKVYQWYTCRELFHSHLYRLNLFFFSTDSNWQSVAAFLQKIEEILNVTPKSRFGPTQRKKIMWIEPSRWWTIPAMRRSLFTILLRCGAQYSLRENNFYEALVGNKYIEFTKYALERFLNGYTAYTGRKRGWVRQFNENNQGFSVDMVDSLLVKPLRK